MTRTLLLAAALVAGPVAADLKTDIVEGLSHATALQEAAESCRRARVGRDILSGLSSRQCAAMMAAAERSKLYRELIEADAAAAAPDESTQRWLDRYRTEADAAYKAWQAALAFQG